MYPIDLWFLIGSYIAPEDVCTFASICRGTHVVTHSARFWLSLYRRSYTLIILLDGGNNCSFDSVSITSNVSIDFSWFW